MKSSSATFLIFVIIIAGAYFFVKQNDLDKTSGESKELGEINQEKNMSNQIATFKTNKGEFKIELFGDKAPKTVENFVTLANQGFYNNTKFHRIIADFMIQGGDPLTKDDSQMTRWGTGGPDYRFADEFGEGLSNVTGTISMANAGPNTNGSQFFINVADNTFLDGKHAVFGKVIEGMDLVMQLSKVETGERDVPVSPVVVESVSISQ